MNKTVVSLSENWDPATYDAPRHRLVPCFDDFYGSAARIAAAAGPIVCDLGAGTGLLAAAVLAARPDARLHLIDGSSSMLDVARQRLAGTPATFAVADLRDPLPDGPFDAVVSALAIHHLSHEDKQALFARVLQSLRPGGVFVNAEQVLGPTPEWDVRYWEAHELEARALGSDDGEWEAAVVRMSVDVCASVGDHLAWLAAAGFKEPDCWFKSGRFAVLAAHRPG